MWLLLLAALGGPAPTVHQVHVDRIEINHWSIADKHEPCLQAIFWQWDESLGHFVVQDYCLLKDMTMPHRHGDRWVCRVFKDGKVYDVSTSIRPDMSFSTFDPDVANRRILDERDRKRLFK